MSLTEVSLNIPTDHMANVFGQFDVYIKKMLIEQMIDDLRATTDYDPKHKSKK